MSIWGSCNIQIYIGDTPHLKGQVLSLPPMTPGTEQPPWAWSLPFHSADRLEMASHMWTVNLVIVSFNHLLAWILLAC